MNGPALARNCYIAISVPDTPQNVVFTITAQILARSLANFYLLISGQTRKFIIYAKRQRARADRLSCVCPVIDNEFRHNIVKVVCGSTRLSPRGSTATSTML